MRKPSDFVTDVVCSLIVIAILSTLLLVFAPTLHAQDDFAQRVADKCKGEAPHALQHCACTVRNRLIAGWSENRVLSAYFAAPVRATQDELRSVDVVLRGDGGACDARWYFMFSDADRRLLRLQDVPALYFVKGATGTVYLYALNVLDRR
jgi:hypothetical protein